ncbi:MAG: hypothetical protein U0136_19845 [Bdellovibrionota bacterium]
MDPQQQASRVGLPTASVGIGPSLLETKSRVTNITRSMTATPADLTAISEFVTKHAEHLKKTVGTSAFLNAALTTVTNSELLQPLRTILRADSEAPLTGHVTFSKDLLSVSLRDQQDCRHGSLQYNYPRKELYRFADAAFYATSNSVEVQAGEALRRLQPLIDRWTLSGPRSLSQEERSEVGTAFARSANVSHPQKTWIHIGKPSSFCFDYDRAPIPAERVLTEVTLAGKQATNLYSIASFVVVRGRENPLTQLFRAPGTA